MEPGQLFVEQSNQMKKESYLIDGKSYTAAETKKVLSAGSLGKREQVALSLVDNTDPNQTIVDLGCLYGFFSKKLKEKFPNSKIIAGDYLDEHLKIARLINPDITPIFQELNAYKLDLEDSSIDTLTFQEVIEHLEGAATAIKEINRVLKVGGILILSTPTAYYWRDMWQAIKYELLRKYFKKNLPLSDSIYFQEHEWNRHIYCWTPSTLYTLLKVNGFEYVAHDYCQDGQSFFEKLVLKIFPFLSPTIIIKVKKTSSAPSKLV
ncbi:MAG TPA: class I SAM-dependent methyltransferase [Alphaproteobacteria bacterium]|nr:class I SAM-dependent methyltransferase [Alphaproteobacteria bacterium]HQS93043.1 class I SAM-dependent methyltransferase [Alphaproteobacteria bacterium]